MATATKQKPEPQTEPSTHVFYSRHGNLRLPRVKQVMRIDQLGQQHPHVYFRDENGQEVTRRVYEFQNGMLQVQPGQDVYPDGPGGEPQDSLTWLRNHHEFNKRYHEHGNEPDRPLPSDEDFHRMLRRHLVALDVEAVVAMLAQERETHKREALIKAGEQVRREILQLRQELENGDPPEAA